MQQVDTKKLNVLVNLMDVDSFVRNTGIHPLDNLYRKGRESHYFSVGYEALWNVIQSMLGTGMTEPQYILDYPSGFGRVTRYLRAAFPDTEIHIGDTGSEAVDYCVDTYHAKNIDIIDWAKTTSTNQYDVIFSGTLLTHLPEEDGVKLLTMLSERLKINGLLIIACSGRKGLLDEQVHFNREIFTSLENLVMLTRSYYNGHYAFINYPEQSGYGRSYIPLSWFHNYIQLHPHLSITRFAERGWDDNLDVITIKRII